MYFIVEDIHDNNKLQYFDNKFEALAFYGY